MMTGSVVEKTLCYQVHVHLFATDCQSLLSHCQTIGAPMQEQQGRQAGVQIVHQPDGSASTGATKTGHRALLPLAAQGINHAGTQFGHQLVEQFLVQTRPGTFAEQRRLFFRQGPLKTWN